MQPLGKPGYGSPSGAKTGPSGKGDRKPVRRRRRQQRGARLTLNKQTRKLEIRYV